VTTRIPGFYHYTFKFRRAIMCKMDECRSETEAENFKQLI
jgi:hypothetical protein